jgi:hypothetical protein
MLRHVVWCKFVDVSEESAAFIIRAITALVIRDKIWRE